MALPIDAMGRRSIGHALPPDIAIIGKRNIRENNILLQRGHAVVVGLVVGAGCNTKVAILGIDRSQLPLRIGLDPGDVITDGGDPPAATVEPFRRNQHGEIGFAAGRRKCRCNVILPAPGRLNPQDQHVFGKPA